jgi:hypothetical protein
MARVKFVPVPVTAPGGGLSAAGLLGVPTGHVPGAGLLAVLGSRVRRVAHLRPVIAVMPPAPGPVDRRSGLVGPDVAIGQAGLGFPH